MQYAYMIAYGEMLGLSVGKIAERVVSAAQVQPPWTAICRHESRDEWITIGYVYPVEFRDRVIQRAEELDPPKAWGSPHRSND